MQRCSRDSIARSVLGQSIYLGAVFLPVINQPEPIPLTIRLFSTWTSTPQLIPHKEQLGFSQAMTLTPCLNIPDNLIYFTKGNQYDFLIQPISIKLIIDIPLN
jgi:hypothetical protein